MLKQWSFPRIVAIACILIASHCNSQQPLRADTTTEPNPQTIDVADVHFPRLSWMVPRNKLDSAAIINKYHGPLLQSHGNRDRTIPFPSGEKLFRSANEPKQFITIEGADHNNWLTQAYLKQLDVFIASVAQPSK